jgi:hypothetical protein
MTAMATARTIGRLAGRSMSDVSVSRIINDLRMWSMGMIMLSARNGYGQTPWGFPIVFDAFEPLMPEHSR